MFFQKSFKKMGGSKFVKARGLPWAATPRDVVKFFDTSNIIGGTSGVHFVVNEDGRASGQCYVELESVSDVESALAKHKEKIGARYIEVFEATEYDFDRDMNKGRGRDRGSVSGRGDSLPRGGNSMMGGSGGMMGRESMMGGGA